MVIGGVWVRKMVQSARSPRDTTDERCHLGGWMIVSHVQFSFAVQSNWNKPSGVKDHSSTSTMEARFLYCATQYSED